MNEQEARTIAAQATGTLVAQYAEAVQLGNPGWDWVVVLALKVMPSSGTEDPYQVFSQTAEWNTATYMRPAVDFLKAYAIYSPSQKVTTLYIDNQPANTNTLHFDTMPTTKEVAAWVEIYLNGRLNSVLADMRANGITELTT